WPLPTGAQTRLWILAHRSEVAWRSHVCAGARSLASAAESRKAATRAGASLTNARSTRRGATATAAAQAGAAPGGIASAAASSDAISADPTAGARATSDRLSDRLNGLPGRTRRRKEL